MSDEFERGQERYQDGYEFGYECGREAGAAAERTAIVVWLRYQADPDNQSQDDKDRLIKTIYYAKLADEIEHGDHARQEIKP